MKSNKPVIIVDSVEKAVKFYTEKMAFDVVKLTLGEMEGKQALTFAHLRKGKCFIHLRVPKVVELAEFSFIKRCTSRCIGMFIEMKKGLDKYFDRCQKKGVQIVSEPKDHQAIGFRTFSVKDPFGIKLTFAQPIEDFVPEYKDFAGLAVDLSKDDDVLVEEMVKYLKGFGILRRAAKKYAKLWLKGAKK